MFWFFVGSLAVRTAIFALLGYSCFFADGVFIQSLLAMDFSIPLVAVVFVYMIAEILLQFIPALNRYVGCGKMYRINYRPAPALDPDALAAYTRQSNRRALWVLFGWIILNGAVLLFYWAGRLSENALVLLAGFYYVCDLVCVLFFCPFQYLLKTRCCATCRIYNWDRFMYCLPLLPIRAVGARLLFFTSLALMLLWETLHLLHPERFYEGANLALRCASCKTRICRIRGLLKNYLK